MILFSEIERSSLMHLNLLYMYKQMIIKTKYYIHHKNSIKIGSDKPAYMYIYAVLRYCMLRVWWLLMIVYGFVEYKPLFFCLYYTTRYLFIYIPSSDPLYVEIHICGAYMYYLLGSYIKIWWFICELFYRKKS